ncbi:hypothetical protein [Raineya sp.]|mgnify:CR=1 FL=1|jgi:hypothetical protein
MKKVALFTLLFCSLLVVSGWAQNSFKFTQKPANEGCEAKGKTFNIEGKLVAERLVGDDGGKALHFVAKKGSDVLLTIVALNPEQEATDISYHYLTKDFLEDLEISDFGGKGELSLDNMYSKYKCESISQFNVKKEVKEYNGTTVGDFKSKKAIDEFKKLLKP